MAWSKEKRLTIKLLEDGMVSILQVMGYLETKGLNESDPMAMRCHGMLAGVFRQWRRIRSMQYEQGELFDAGEGKESQKGAGDG